MLQLHNTRTRKLELFTPLTETVRIYSCGPTVYDNIHIGNLSAFVASDTLRRVLGQSYPVKHVMNFTDVDDKTIAKSRSEHPDLDPIQALLATTQVYSDVFLKDMRAIGNDVSALEFTKATDFIEQMKALIVDLHTNGIAYTTDDGVYFSIEGYRAKGKTYGQLTEITAANTSNERIHNDEYDKDSIHDFALWKVAKDNEPFWNFALDGVTLDGRPGWHIECSAMSAGTLGTPFDIHTGGIDLTFPHHENEIAQSTAAGNDVYAQFFMHNEHLLVEGKKMSKSLQNFYTLRDIEAKGFEPLAFRLVVLQSHYRSRTNFSWGSIEAAQNRLNNLREFADLRFQGIPDAELLENNYFAEQKQAITAALQNDLDTPIALSLLSEVITHINQNGLHPSQLETFVDFITYLDDVFGLSVGKSEDISAEQKTVIAERDLARQNDDWATSDTLRDQLLEQGIGLRDAPSGAVWFRLPS